MIFVLNLQNIAKIILSFMIFVIGKFILKFVIVFNGFSLSLFGALVIFNSLLSNFKYYKNEKKKLANKQYHAKSFYNKFEE